MYLARKKIQSGFHGWSAEESPAEKHPLADAQENTAQDTQKWVTGHGGHEFIDEGAPNWNGVDRAGMDSG